jgi:prevent-host-death family protein
MMTTLTGHELPPMEINAAEFKAKCLKLLDEVAATHEPLVITKRGKPVARLVPIEEETAESMFGYLRGTVTILGDIVEVPHEPLAAETGEEDELYRPLTRPGKSAR